MILGLQTDTFGTYGGIPTYNRLVCRVLDEFDSHSKGSVLIAMDKQGRVEREAPLHPNLRLTGFAGDRVRFVTAALRTVVRDRINLTLAGHLNYAPLCLLLKVFRPRMRFGVLIYGWDAWVRLPLMRRWALQQADFIISISDYTKRQAVALNGLDEKRIFVLPNALEWKASEAVEKVAPPSLPLGTRLLSVGRLLRSEQQKGFDTVIRSLPSIMERVADVQYIIIGSGTDLERHKQLAREIRVTHRVHFLGTVDDATLRSCYENCDVFVMPSAQEGFGFVYLEAMQYAKAVVAARSGGAQEVVEDQVTGRLVEYNNEDELAQALIELCLDQEKRTRLGAAGYQRLQERFTFAQFKQKLTEILAGELPPRMASSPQVPAGQSTPQIPNARRKHRIPLMKVLHVIPSISGQAGGPSQAILPMCRALREHGVDLLLATTDDGSSPENGTATLQYGQISDHKGQPAIFFPSQIGASFKYSRPFSKWLNSNVANYDLVHIHAVFNHACIAAAHACRRHGVPYIVRPLGTLDPWSMNQKSWRKKVFWHGGIKRMLNSAAAVQYTAKAEQMATEQSLGLNHGVVVPLGVERHTGKLASRNTLAHKLPSLGERSYVLVLSRLLPTKGIDVLLEAFLSLLKRRDFAQWRLVLAGEGPAEYVAKLKRTTAAADGSEQVLFPGWLDGNEKEAALSNASLLALPSYHENFGLCVMEALAFGVPVLVSPHVNLAADIEAAGAGWIAEIEKEAVQSALEAALNSGEERIRRGAEGRTLAGRFDWSVIAATLMDFYSSILETKAGVSGANHV